MAIEFIDVEDVTEADPGPLTIARRAAIEAACLDDIMARSPGARLLHLVAQAFRVHGFGEVGIGLYHPETFPEHAPGIGVGAGLPGYQRPAGAWLLKSMGCDDLRDVLPGVLGTLRGPLLAAPPPGTCPEPVGLPGRAALICPWCDQPFIPGWKQGRIRFCSREHATRYWSARQKRSGRP